MNKIWVALLLGLILGSAFSFKIRATSDESCTDVDNHKHKHGEECEEEKKEEVCEETHQHVETCEEEEDDEKCDKDHKHTQECEEEKKEEECEEEKKEEECEEDHKHEEECEEEKKEEECEEEKKEEECEEDHKHEEECEEEKKEEECEEEVKEDECEEHKKPKDECEDDHKPKDECEEHKKPKDECEDDHKPKDKGCGKEECKDKCTCEDHKDKDKCDHGDKCECEDDKGKDKDHDKCEKGHDKDKCDCDHKNDDKKDKCKCKDNNPDGDNWTNEKDGEHNNCKGSKYLCGESDAVNKAWNDARQAVRNKGGSAEEEIMASARAAYKAGANGPTTICIAFDAGVATGKDTCWIINYIVQQAIYREVKVKKAEEWCETAAKKRYSWYEGYKGLCGNRPDYDICEHDNGGDNGSSKNLCGESDKVHAAWTAARSEVWNSAGDAKTLIDKSTFAAILAGASVKQATCISVDAGVSSGMDTCALINYSVQWWIFEGLSIKEAEERIDDGVHKRYDWYTTYKELCGDRPKYAMYKSK